MCGIIGYINKAEKLSKTDLDIPMNTIKHRGPDAQDTYLNEENSLILGHLRLSIIDLSTSANQPFFFK